MISAEAPPLRRGGAIVDVLTALPEELRSRGHEVSIVLPFYRELRDSAETADTGVTVEIRVGEQTYVAEFWESQTAAGVQVFLVKCDHFFDRPEIYGERGGAYDDNVARFIFFNKAAVELARRLTPEPQVLHLHDWATALVPMYVHAHHLPFRTVLTIHRIAEQGSFWGLDFALTNLPQRYFTLRGAEFFGRLNFLKTGIVFADAVTTVSEHHRQEILTPAGGAGLDFVLREERHKLVGILSGADYPRWNSVADPHLPVPFEAAGLEGKAKCRAALLAEMKLARAPRGPVFGMVTRLVTEKGLDLVMPLLDRLLSDDVRLIILGEGAPKFETALAVAARRYSKRFAYRRQFDERLAHLIEAGADITLIPSQFEPGGLIAMYSLRYGALPVAQAAGGIEEIVQDYDPVLGRGYGFLSYEYSVEAYWDAIKRARELFLDQSTWRELMQRAMAVEFAWAESATRYEDLYRALVGEAEVAA